MSEIRVNSLGNESNTGGPVLSGITTFSGQQYFIPPKGTTAERPSDCPPGSIRFNTDSAHLEYWNGLVWLEFEASSNELGNQNNTNSSGGTGTRGVFMGGGNPTAKTDIDYITVETLGNAQDFGDLSGVERGANNGQIASRTRGFMIGGDQPAVNGDVERIIFASTGSSVDTGLNFSVRRLSAGCSNQTRAILAGGYDNPSGADNNIIECTEMASLGSKQDFGDLSLSRYFPSGVSSSVRGIFVGGIDAGVDEVNIIDYITISTTGNALEFGDISEKGRKNTASNSTRGVLAGGYIDPGANTNVIEFITIATTGNSQDFGDMDVAKRDGAAVSSPTRMVIAGGYDGSSFYDAMDYITILTTGNSVDFGDLVGTDRFRATGASNGHGGL
jgi:hypothetical protein